MFDHDAWMQRGAERQKLLQELKRAAIDQEMNAPAFGYELSRILFHTLAVLSGLEEFPLSDNEVEVQKEAQAFFDEVVMPKVKEFSSSEPEQYKILVDLFAHLSDLILGQFTAAFDIWESSTFGSRTLLSSIPDTQEDMFRQIKSDAKKASRGAFLGTGANEKSD